MSDSFQLHSVSAPRRSDLCWTAKGLQGSKQQQYLLPGQGTASMLQELGNPFMHQCVCKCIRDATGWRQHPPKGSADGSKAEPHSHSAHSRANQQTPNVESSSESTPAPRDLIPHPQSSPPPAPSHSRVLYLLEGMANGGTEACGGPQPFML